MAVSKDELDQPPKLGKKLWQEDDVNYEDKVRINAAYEKLFGVRYDAVERTQIADCGDCFYYVTPHAIVCSACDGDSIFAKPENAWGAWRWLRDGHTVFMLMPDGFQKGVEKFKNRVTIHVAFDRDIPEEEQNATAERIAACLNACEGWDDPVSSMRRLAEAFKVLMEQIEKIKDEKPTPDTIKGFQKLVQRLETGE